MYNIDLKKETKKTWAYNVTLLRKGLVYIQSTAKAFVHFIKGRPDFTAKIEL